MLFDELGDASKNLIRGRARAMGNSLNALARDYSHRTSAELADAVNSVEARNKPALGLLLARVTLEEALSARSRELFNRFVFRFAAHLRASISLPGQSVTDRLCLATASERLLRCSPTTSSKQLSEATAIRNRLSSTTLDEAAWSNVFDNSSGTFTTAISLLNRELGGQRKRQARKEWGGGNLTPPTPTRAVQEFPISEAPTWLRTALSPEPDILVASTANWSSAQIGTDPLYDINRAWSAFKARKYGTSAHHLSGLLRQVPENLGPTSSADSLRMWNWLRLIVELAALEEQRTIDRRRSWTSATVLLHRCLPNEESLLDDYIDEALNDFTANDPASRRALSVYSTRLVAELGHEVALFRFTNRQKADLREIWQHQHSLDPADSRSTKSAVEAVDSRYRTVSQRLYTQARQEGAPARALRESSHEIAAFLDESEAAILASALEIVEDIERASKLDGVTRIDLSEFSDELQRAHDEIRESGSLLLQDQVAPYLVSAQIRLQTLLQKLGDSSRPSLSVTLASSRVPFSAAAGQRVGLRLFLRNIGNVPAESINLSVIQSELGIDAGAHVDSLSAGAETSVTVPFDAPGKSPRVVELTCVLTWSDALLQQFGAEQKVSAEDQMPAAWSVTDVNPFNLGTISEPDRLVGRDDDLISLDGLIAGNASAYITGHKRVGKTSLTRVLLARLDESRGWAGSVLPLGRTLGADQSASDLVYGLLDEILDAARSRYARSLSTITEITVDDSGNFARAANRWLRTMARQLPSDARVIVAIDDFDELPPHLVEGPKADALFLFLRSLIDEPWLNLIIVGSEILPSIIQAQAHKLNQVVPVSVTNFASRSSTEELLRTPTKDRLEWLAEAVDRMHYLCAGNPYYETLIAQRVWQTMRERSRSVVTAPDVDEAASHVARDAPEAHFIHLWADSAQGLNHTTREAVVASAVLRSVARCGGAELVPASSDEIVRVAQGWIETATSDELIRAASTLRARGVLESGPSSDTLLLTIPLVGIWLQAEGSRALDALYSSSKHATATVRIVTEADLVELARSLRYRGEQISEIRVKAWLNQFGDHYRQYLAFKMLRRMVLDGYFTANKLQETVMPRLYQAVTKLNTWRFVTREANNQSLRNAYLINHGAPGDSTQGTLSVIAKSLGIKKAHIVRPSELAEKIRKPTENFVLFLLDDFSGSGSHLSTELRTLSDALLGLGAPWIDHAHVVVGAAIVSGREGVPVTDLDVAFEAVSGTTVGTRLLAFDADSGVFDNEKERSDAEEMTRSIGSALLKNAPLGFGDQALLTLFEFNCPNNVPPIFWRGGTVAGQAWLPLFERAV